MTQPVGYGYRGAEILYPEIPDEIKQEYMMVLNSDPTPRRPKCVSTGTHYQGLLRPAPDLDDPLNKVLGATKRVAKLPRRAKRTILKRLRRFTRKWCRANLTPLSVDTDVSVETWLASTKYSAKRKAQLLKLHKECFALPTDVRIAQVKGFLKDETYDTWKHPRWIMSRSDEFKCMYGPIIKKIEEVVYNNDDGDSSFIKHVPDSQRPAYIKNRLYSPGNTYLVTDYTAFESHFIPEIMTALEFELYDYMTKFLPEHEFFMRCNRSVIAKPNHIVSRNMWFDVAARMSGEMSTSLGNGFSNLMLMLFTCERNGCKNVRGVVEGDDGLFAFDGPPPTREMFAEAGFDIKLDAYTSLTETSFCGMVFDEDSMQTITDPFKAIVNFGWTSRQYLNCSSVTMQSLVRAKSLSLMVQYKGCPMVAAVAAYGIRTTDAITRKRMMTTIKKLKVGQYEKDRMFERMAAPSTREEPSDGTRILFEKRYGVPIADQIAFEKHMDSLNTLAPFSHPGLTNHAPECYRQMWSTYFVGFHHEYGNPPIPEQWDERRVEKIRGIIDTHWNKNSRRINNM